MKRQYYYIYILLIIEQNNYSNTYLKVIDEKLNKIEDKVDPIKLSKTFDIEKPLFTSYEILSKLKFSFKIKKKIILTLLEEIFKTL